MAKIVFVLDISYSMYGLKCQTLHLAATRYIEDVPDQSYVGIVLFDNFASVEHNVVRITDRSVRDALLAKVPQMARGSTNIGDGLLTGLKSLTDAGLSTEGATLILVTDGGDTTRGNYVDRVIGQLLASKVKVVCIAIGNDADQNLERLSNETAGNVYVASDNNREMAARVIESTIQEVKSSKELNESTTIEVCNDIIALNKSLVVTNVIMDADIGRNTNITIGSEGIDKFEVTIESPSGQKYHSSTTAQFTKNQSLKRYQLKVTNAESGNWTINFLKNTKDNISVTLTVSSQPNVAKPLALKVWLKEADAVQQLPPIIFAEIRRGMETISGAEVTATVDKPDGSQSVVKLIQFENIYSNYFADYSGDGRYNVSVLAKSEPKTDSGFSQKLFSTDQPFQRQRIAGCFKVAGIQPRKPDDTVKLAEISRLESKRSLALPVGQSVSLPAPRIARAKIVKREPAPRRADQPSDEIVAAKDELRQLYLVVNRLLSFDTKLTAKQKEEQKSAIDSVDKFIASTSLATMSDVDSNREKLNSVRRVLV